MVVFLFHTLLFIKAWGLKMWMWFCSPNISVLRYESCSGLDSYSGYNSCVGGRKTGQLPVLWMLGAHGLVVRTTLEEICSEQIIMCDC